MRARTRAPTRDITVPLAAADRWWARAGRRNPHNNNIEIYILQHYT